MSRDAIFFVNCSQCEKLIGELDADEFLSVWGEHGGWPLCFDCDPIGANREIDVLKWIAVGDLAVIDGQEFWVNRNVNGDLVWRTHTRMRSSLISSLSLSSSTNLNTAPYSDNQDTVVFYEFFTCPECARNYLHLVKDGWYCENCGFLAPQRKGVRGARPPIVPSTSKGEDEASSEDCPVCQHRRIYGLAEYCSYHHALLVEQHEDGSLGYGNE